jgi:hypothetical protein
MHTSAAAAAGVRGSLRWSEAVEADRPLVLQLPLLLVFCNGKQMLRAAIGSGRLRSCSAPVPAVYIGSAAPHSLGKLHSIMLSPASMH